MNGVTGIHHVTAIAGNSQSNLDFYIHVLGLRLVKKTVNFDDPGTYHFYFGDDAGSPGTLLTFFPWGKLPVSPNNKKSSGLASSVALSINIDHVEYWVNHLREQNVANINLFERFGEPGIAFDDPDGLSIELIGNRFNTKTSNIDKIHSVTLTETSLEYTEAMLNFLGYRKIGNEDNRIRFKPAVDESIGATAKGLNNPADGLNGYIDVIVDNGPGISRMLPGTIHHVALRTPNVEEQAELRKLLLSNRVPVSDVRDRIYFQSIYFHEPGGVLFEIATDDPGFQIDEDINNLGANLMLPPWLENDRLLIAKRLPSVTYKDVRTIRGENYGG